MSNNINTILEKLQKLKDDQDFIKEHLDLINTRTHNIKFELRKLTKFLHEQETPEINELIDKFKQIKIDTKIVQTKLNLFYSKEDIYKQK